ncbi:AAA family ATPase [Halogeometricum luteum]|uniref:Replication factor C small subunit n=1 Tax=Halogeometricum luteum TaxID=2950537 RepID=A0ABU2G6K5_9EURY|nr:AAA family ATPase [Halogeometricum sp. S3BR5-2]MDS0296425.1 AAA family ATPase [Halogeometricum sp. S3BR5-2]
MPKWKQTETWTEKYRPDSFGEIDGNESIISTFQNYSRTGEFPNLLLVGPPGTGKSTVMRILSKEIHGAEWRTHTHILDGMDVRGVDQVRSRILPFIKTDYKGEAPRLLVIEQSESLVRDAQMMLRPLMERHTDRVRVILTCNDVSLVSSSVQSLCAVYRFSPVDREMIRNRLTKIARSEGVSVTDEAIDALSRIADGDLRRAINALQAVGTADDDRITESDVDDTLTSVRPDTVKNMVYAALAGDYEEAVSKLHELLSEGVSGKDILFEAHNVAHNLENFDESTLRLINQIGEAAYRLDAGGDASVQISSVLADVAQQQSD